MVSEMAVLGTVDQLWQLGEAEPQRAQTNTGQE